MSFEFTQSRPLAVGGLASRPSGARQVQDLLCIEPKASGTNCPRSVKAALPVGRFVAQEEVIQLQPCWPRLPRHLDLFVLQSSVGLRAMIFPSAMMVWGRHRVDYQGSTVVRESSAASCAFSRVQPI